MLRLLTVFLSIALLSNAGAAVSGLYTYEINPDGASVTITDYPKTESGAIEIPATLGELPVTSIGVRAFEYTVLTSITIPNSVTSIRSYAFYQCSVLTSVIIPNSVTSIGDRAFTFCTALTSITIPDNVTSIGINAFFGCWSLTSVIIPNSVTSIGDGAFSSCTSLAIVTILGSVTSIGNEVFSNCTSLTSISIPDSVTSIGNKVFSNCTSLTSINIPNGVTSIGDGAFSSCTGLTSISILGSVTSIGNEVFSNCTSLTSITIPDSVTSIGDQAFSSCSSLTSINIPNSVTSIGFFAFAGCTSLTSFVVAVDHPNYSSIELLLLNKNGTVLFTGPGASGDFIIPDSIISIGDGAFGSCSSLTSITIPDSVTSIGALAFYLCSSLTSITIPDSVTSIGYGAFIYCTNLASIRFQSIVAPAIGETAFDEISPTAMIHYRQGATGYETSYDGRPTLEDDFAYSTADEVNTAVATATFGLYTSTELIDLRPGSSQLQIGNNSVTLQLQIQRSDDLSEWSSTPDDLIEVELPMQQGKGFYRFAMP